VKIFLKMRGVSPTVNIANAFPKLASWGIFCVMNRLLTLAETAAELGVSKRWFQYWLGQHPVDGAGIPFYVPIGRNKRFDQADIGRIKSAIREGERCRLNSIGATGSTIIAEQLDRLASAVVFGVPARPKTKISRRVRLPSSKPTTGKVISMDQRQS
jgi:hypothetical protein